MSVSRPLKDICKSTRITRRSRHRSLSILSNVGRNGRHFPSLAPPSLTSIPNLPSTIQPAHPACRSFWIVIHRELLVSETPICVEEHVSSDDAGEGGSVRVVHGLKVVRSS